MNAINMNVGLAIARNTVVQTIGKIVSIALGWGIVLTLTNYLGAAGFGAYTIMTAYLQFFGVAADLGFVLVSAQLLAEHPNDKDRVFANLLGFRLATSAALIAIGPLVIWLFPYDLVVKQGVVILAFTFLVIALLQVFTGLFQKELAMGRALVAEVASRIVLFGVVLFAVQQGQGLLFVVSGVVVGSIVNIVVASLLARRFVRLSFAYDKALWKEMWQRAWPIAAGLVFNLVYLKADTLILSLTRSQFEVGVYGAMYRVLEVLVTFPTMFAGLLLPALSVAWASNDIAGFRRLLQHSLDASIYLAWPMVVGVGFTAPRLASLFGPEFSAAGLILWTLVLATAVIFVGTLFAHVIVALNKQRAVIGLYGITAVVSLVGYLVFIPRYGPLAAAVMTVLAELFISVLVYLAVRHFTGAGTSFRALPLAVVGSVPMAAFLYLASALPLLPLVIGAALVYLVTLVIMGVLTREFMTSVLFSRQTPTT